MIVVERPEATPGQCIVNLSSEDPVGFVDTLLTPAVVDPRIYVSYRAIVDMGRLFGIPDREAFNALEARCEDLENENAGLREDNKTLERDVESAEWTLQRRFGSGIQNKPGRPRKNQEQH